MLVYLNGGFVPKDKALISVFDHGYLYGDGIYETLRAYDGTLFLLGRHLERLERSAKAIYLKLPMSLSEIGEALKESLTKNNLKDAYVRIQISRGPGDIGLDPKLCPEPTMVIIAKPFSEYPVHYYEKGVSVSVAATRRNHPSALDPSVKATNFLNNILAKVESLSAGAYEGIMLNWEGYIAEGTISNVFWAREGRLFTPALSVGILPGVTRSLVLELARQNGIPVEEGAYKQEELFDAEECFITNTTMEVMPVTSIEGRTVGSGVPGPVTKLLAAAYKKEVKICLQTRGC